MFMGFVSSPGFVSCRSKKYGSRFIQTFTTIINDEIYSPTRTEKINFVSLMTKVTAEVADMNGKVGRDVSLQKLGVNQSQKQKEKQRCKCLGIHQH